MPKIKTIQLIIFLRQTKKILNLIKDKSLVNHHNIIKEPKKKNHAKNRSQMNTRVA